jgi:putative spermidine/putrescine transport system substrate-binding protein
MDDRSRPMGRNLSRRLLLKAAGAALATRIAAPGGFAWAQSAGCERVVVGTWGGDYAKFLDSNIGEPLHASAGLEAVNDIGSASQRKTKLLAEKARPRGTFDVVCLDQSDMAQMARQGLLQHITANDVPNLERVLEPLRKPYSIPHLYSARVIVFNPDKVPAPRSYRDLWKAPFAGKIGFADLLAVPILESAALAWGGGPTDYEPGKPKLLELKARGVRIYPSNEALATALASGEIWATIMWRSRAHQWRRAGIPVASAVPEEGATPITFEAAVPRNAPSRACALRYLNRMLDADAQAKFAEAMGYLPTVRNAELPSDLRKELDFTPEERDRFFKPDLGYLDENNSAFKEWWDKEFKS